MAHRSTRALLAVGAYAGLQGGALWILGREPDGAEELGAILVLGLVLAAAAWVATVRIEPAPAPVRRPGAELGVVVTYLAAFSLLFLGPGLSALHAAFPAGPGREVAVLAAKLLFMVAVPGLLLVRRGAPWRELLGPPRLGRGGARVLLVMGALLLGVQLLVGRGWAAVTALPSPAWQVAALAPLALAWMVVEAGLTEEFLFRTLLQTRASTALRSEVAGVLAMAIAFGLAHAPGYVLRGAHLAEGMAAAPGALRAAAYAFAVVSPMGLAFGVLWARTRSLLLVALLHGWFDLVPNLAGFVRTWAG